MARPRVPIIRDAGMRETPPAKVAIVDDDASVRDALRFLIEILGHPVQTFDSAVDFLRAEVSRFSHLILDHHMPHMTGLDLAERLRADGVVVPILLISGSMTPAIAARAAELGVERVLEKPLSEQDLMNFINRVE